MTRSIIRIVAQDTQSAPVLIHGQESLFRNNEIVHGVLYAVQARDPANVGWAEIEILIDILDMQQMRPV